LNVDRSEIGNLKHFLFAGMRQLVKAARRFVRVAEKGIRCSPEVAMLETLETSSNGLRGQSIWCGALTPGRHEVGGAGRTSSLRPTGSAAGAMEVARSIGEDASRSQVLRGSHLVSMPANGKRCSQKPFGGA
jgi:hypothetical protein